MQYRTLGNSDLKLSVLGLGCNNFGGRADVPTTKRVIDHCVDVGVNHFDTADIYGGDGKSEDFMGQVIGDKRKKMIIATKFGLPMTAGSGGSRKYMTTAIEASLKRLRTDYIDLYYLHKPDHKTPIEETLGALNELKKQGKIRWYANSNMEGSEIDAADAVAKKNNFAPFVAAQDELSLIKRGTERDRIPAMLRHGLSFIPYFPLASGLLTGKYKRNQPMPAGTRLSTPGRLADVFVHDNLFELTYKIGDFCDKRGYNMLDVAFAWLLAKPYITSVIAGAVKTEQIDANAKATDFKLSAADVAELDKLTVDAVKSQPH